MDAIANYIRIAAEHSVTLQLEELREKDRDHDKWQDHFFHRLQLRDELIEATPSAKALLLERGLDPMPLIRTTLAAECFVNRYQDEWFACHAFLMANETKPVSRDCPISMAALYELCVKKVNRVGQEVAGSNSTVRGWKNAKGFPETMTWSSVREWLNRTKDYDIGNPPTEC
ncbi:MAG: hypothetical protein SFV81_27185 [Pirellulaceae bacterium]|nr:hypothetical protein [Pirellulaceae bacterium]